MTWGRIGGVGGAVLATASIAFSLAHPWGNLRSVPVHGPILEGSAVPEDVRRVFEAKCADCHSNQTHWPVYSRLAPASWLMEHDVYAGRAAMNLSNWAMTGADDRIAMLARIAAEARTGEMPPRPYTMLHPATHLTDSDKQQIVAWTRAERKRIKSASTPQKETGSK